MSQHRSPFIQRLIRSRFLIVVNLLVIIFLGISFGREVVRSRSIASEISALQAQADELTMSNQEMLNLQTAMQTESFIEREARLKLGLKKPGETVVVIQQEGSEDLSQIPEDPLDPLDFVIDDATPQEELGNPLKWWYYFFDKMAFNTMVD